MQTRTIADIEFSLIPGGSFEMGDIFGEGDEDEQPVHTVECGHFYMSRCAVTFAQYDAFCDETGLEKPDDFGWGRDRRPVVDVSFFDAVRFCKWVSDKSGSWVRLPEEAEWEYAAREGGRKVRFGNGENGASPEQINFDARSSHKEPYSEVGRYNGMTVPVGSFAPNGLGLHEMSGNVWEWCDSRYTPNYKDRFVKQRAHVTYRVDEDTFDTVLGGATIQLSHHDDVRVLRGGAFDSYPRNVRATLRGWDNGRTDNPNRGFRLVADV